MDIWNRYFRTTFKGKEYTKQKYFLPLLEKDQLIFDRCIFLRLKLGALTFASDNIQILNNECIFKDCSRSGSSGGAIQFEGKSNFVQYRTFAENCKAISATRSFCSVSLKDSLDKHAYIIDSSITSCSNPDFFDVITMTNGNFGVSSINLSQNIVSQTCVFALFSAKNELVLMNYSCIVDSRSTTFHVTFNDVSGNYKYYKCNFFNSSQQNSGLGNIYELEVNVVVDSCAIIKCLGPGSTFYGNKGSITVQNCYFDAITKAGSVNTKSMTNKDMTFELSFYYPDLKCIDNDDPYCNKLDNMSCIIKRPVRFVLLIYILFLN